jgi:hypothetical protein
MSKHNEDLNVGDLYGAAAGCLWLAIKHGGFLLDLVSSFV